MKYPCKAALMGLFFLFICLAACAQQPKNEYKGRVLGISDGDTFTFLSAEKKQIKDRLLEIDTPESEQTIGTRAKQVLSDLIFSKEVLSFMTNEYGVQLDTWYHQPGFSFLFLYKATL